MYAAVQTGGSYRTCGFKADLALAMVAQHVQRLCSELHRMHHPFG